MRLPRRLFRYYFPPPVVWASAPALLMGKLGVGALMRLVPLTVFVGVTWVGAWWGSTSPSLSSASWAFVAPLVGLVAGLLSMVAVVLVDALAEWMHVRWGRARWSEAGAHLQAEGLAVLQSSARARLESRRWLERDPEGLFRARHLFRLTARSWPDRQRSRWAKAGAGGIIETMEQAERVRRTAATMAKSLPPAAKGSRNPRPRF